jgi:ribosomal protein L37E
MNATFCSNCGSKHTFTYAKPKFCSSCGFSLGPELKKSASSSAAVDDDSYDDDEDEDSDFSNASFVPRLKKLELDIEKYSESNSFTLGSIFGESNSQPVQPRRRTAQSLGDFINDKPRRGE